MMFDLSFYILGWSYLY